MKVSVIVAMVALLAVSTSAVPSWRHPEKSAGGDGNIQIAGGSNNNAGTSGALNNAIAGGILSKNSKDSSITQILH